MDLTESSEEQVEKQASIFAALGDLTRLRLVKLLCCQCAPNALCVNALAANLDITQSAVSQHLRVLRAIGLVKGERRGYHVHYFINQDALERYRNLVSAALTTDELGKEQPCENHCPRRKENQVSLK